MVNAENVHWESRRQCSGLVCLSLGCCFAAVAGNACPDPLRGLLVQAFPVKSAADVGNGLLSTDMAAYGEAMIVIQNGCPEGLGDIHSGAGVRHGGRSCLRE